MNRLKMKKLAILATLGIIIFTLIPAVQGAKTGINFRPIDDWVYGPNPDVWAESDYLPWGPNNPFGSGGGYGDPDSMLVIWLFEWIANDPWNDYQTYPPYDGFVLERVMPDGSLKITVNLEVKGMPMGVRVWGGPWVLEGFMDFTYQIKFILEKEIPGGFLMNNVYDEVTGEMIFEEAEDGTNQPLIARFHYISEELPDRDAGAELPPWWMMYFHGDVVGARILSTHFNAKGFGNLIDLYWEPIGTAKVRVNQIMLSKPGLSPDHPNGWIGTKWDTPYGVFEYKGAIQESPLLTPEIWPVEFVRIY
ncbi:MAG: hypothetical protein ACTSQU_04325 [Promethearchaeota archaeon]